MVREHGAALREMKALRACLSIVPLCREEIT